MFSFTDHSLVPHDNRHTVHEFIIRAVGIRYLSIGMIFVHVGVFLPFDLQLAAII